MNWLKRFFQFILKSKEKVIRLSLGLVLVYTASFLLFTRVEPIATWVALLENLSYDLQVRQMHKGLAKDVPVAIIDIDDKSINEEGRWPWTRKKMAELVTKLYENGATVIGFDITFPDPEINIADEVFREIEKRSPEQIGLQSSVRQSFDYDLLFANSLKLGDSCLGMVFTHGGETAGVLPEPIMELKNPLSIPSQPAYLANIALLKEAAKTEGFINATPDADGVLRFTPLLYRNGMNLYGSLSLQAVSLYLLTQKVQLVTHTYGQTEVLEGIRLDKTFIPTDEMGRILIPYRGKPYTFHYISATDVLRGKVPREQIAGKLLFLGATASAIGDVRPASISSLFPGIEIHASVASGILDGYLPYKPTWGKGVTFLVMVAVGTLYAILFPFLGVLSICVLSLVLPIALIYANYHLWVLHGIVISLFLPVGLIALLFIMNVVWGYLFESQRSKEIKAMFGQYVPPAYLEDMLKRGEEFNLEGETKEMSVLFADIRSFTNFSEKMTAAELKRFLNRYFDPMTEAIFNHQGTIDKYVGDMVMAFWGAPLTDSRHAYNAVLGGLAMQAALARLNQELISENKPQVNNGVGVNTGVMNVGDMGSKFRKAYTVLGDTVNLASRLEGQTKFYRIGMLVAEGTYQSTKDEFAYRKVDKIMVKGKDVGINIYCPICEKKNVTAEITEELRLHHLALDDYVHQKWDAAESAFKSLVVQYPQSKGLYEVYLERISKYRQDPPPADWDGTYISHEK